jgi:glycosyltransferase involved in cell wall biosynthesis
MRVAYYYHQPRLAPADPNTNPYGPLLCAALERRGIACEFAFRLDEEFLREHRGRLDVLHLNWPHYDYYHDDAVEMARRMRTFVRRLELARELGYRVVWTAHNLYPHNRRHQALDHECRLAICRLATAVIAHCRVAAEAIARTFGRADRLFIIPHGHFIGVYPDTVTRAQARAALGVPADAFAYGFFGSIQPYKGVERLIEAFGDLPFDDAWLLISGGGKAEYLDHLRQRAADHPRIVLRTYPRAPTEEIALIMRAADAIALPFAATLTSGTLILALSWGRPVIAPALGCLPETVTPAAGILYDPTDRAGLPTALRAIRGWDLAAASAAALACARRFDWEEIAALTEEAYRA